MAETSFKFGIPFFNIGWTQKDHSFTILEGQTIIMRVWKWRKVGYQKKAITLNKGKIEVQLFD
jgi:hypothetical protein